MVYLEDLKVKYRSAMQNMIVKWPLCLREWYAFPKAHYILDLGTLVIS